MEIEDKSEKIFRITLNKCEVTMRNTRIGDRTHVLSIRGDAGTFFWNLKEDDISKLIELLGNFR
jgi:hypothetical protein